MNAGKTHWSFWLIVALMLIWSVMGCINFFVQMNPNMVSSYSESEQTIIQGRPIWATIGFAISVTLGALGSVLLLLRYVSAFYVFVASLMGTVIAIAHSLTLNITFGVGEIVGIIVMPVLVSVFFIWYSKYAQGKGWLRAHAKSIQSTASVSID